MTMRRLYLCGWLILAMVTSTIAQQMTEQEVNTQKIFIEAIKQRELGRTDEAIELYKQVLESDRRNAAAAYELGRLYHYREDLQEAMRYLQQATEWSPDNEWYSRYLADLYQAAGRNEEAAALYANLVTRSAGDAELYHKWAHFLVRANELPQAIAVYDRLEQRLGVDEETSRRKHALYLALGDKKKAEAELEKLAAAYPDETGYWHLLAAYYAANNEDNKARTTYQAILRVDPSDAKAQLALQEGSQAVAGSEDQQYLSSLAPIFGRADVDIDLKIGKLLPFITRVAEKNDVQLADAALALTDILTRVHSDQAKAFAAQGDLYFHTDRYAAAAAAYRQATELDESIYPVWEQLLTSLYYTTEITDLADQASQALDIFPNRPILYYYHAWARLLLQQPDRAIDDLEQAMLMAGRNAALLAQLQALLGQAQLATGATKQGDESLAKALTVLANTPLGDYYRAQQQLYHGAPDQALAAASRASSAEPTDPYFRWAQAAALYELGKHTDAKQLYAGLLKDKEPGWPLLLEQYGDVHYQLGATDEAVRYWEMARQRGGTSPTLKKKIAERKLVE